MITEKKEQQMEWLRAEKSDINWNIDPLSAGHTNLFIQVKLRSSHKCSKDALEVDKKWQEKVKMCVCDIKIKQITRYH